MTFRCLKEKTASAEINSPCQKNVATFDVSVANICNAVKILQSQYNRGTNSTNTIPWKEKSSVGLQQIGHAASFTKLHDDPHLTGFRCGWFYAFKVTNNIGRVTPAKDFNLSLYLFLFAFGAAGIRNHFHGDNGAGRLVRGAIHGSETSFPYQVQDIQFVGSIVLRKLKPNGKRFGRRTRKSERNVP